MVLTKNRTLRLFRYSSSASRRSGRWLRPPPPGRSIAHSFPARAHQILSGSFMRILRFGVNRERAESEKLDPPGPMERRRATWKESWQGSSEHEDVQQLAQMSGAPETTSTVSDSSVRVGVI